MLVAIVVWIAVVAGLVLFLGNSQRDGRRLIVARTQTRVQLGAEFATLYVKDLLSRERTEGLISLEGRDVSGATFDRVARGMGLSAAVLLDSKGRLLQVLPADPALIGVAIGGKYAHLASAVAGRAAVSDVVPSAARHLPVVGFATPFQTASGRRVFSGAYDVSRTPLGAYLREMTSLPGRRVYLVDAQGELIASSQGDLPQATLRQASPGLASASQHASSGRFAAKSGEQYFVSAPVTGTPWRLLMSVPEAQLFQSMGGPWRWLTWLAIFGLACAGFGVILLFDKLHRGRAQMRQLNAELERIAHTDELTGLRNRRSIEKALANTLSAARRHEQSFAVLMIDVDHFKRVNDTLGHHGGDQVLIEVSRALSESLRTEDVIGRWGGEEFLVVLPYTGEAGAARSAERLRKSVARRTETTGSGPDVTVTVGLAQWSGETCDDLIARADAALYAGKAAGRNVVHTAPSLEHVSDLDRSFERVEDQVSPGPIVREPAA